MASSPDLWLTEPISMPRGSRKRTVWLVCGLDAPKTRAEVMAVFDDLTRPFGSRLIGAKAEQITSVYLDRYERNPYGVRSPQLLLFIDSRAGDQDEVAEIIKLVVKANAQRRQFRVQFAQAGARIASREWDGWRV